MQTKPKNNTLCMQTTSFSVVKPSGAAAAAAARPVYYGDIPNRKLKSASFIHGVSVAPAQLVDHQCITSPAPLRHRKRHELNTLEECYWAQWKPSKTANGFTNATSNGGYVADAAVPPAAGCFKPPPPPKCVNLPVGVTPYPFIQRDYAPMQMCSCCQRQVAGGTPHSCAGGQRQSMVDYTYRMPMLQQRMNNVFVEEDEEDAMSTTCEDNTLTMASETSYTDTGKSQPVTDGDDTDIYEPRCTLEKLSSVKSYTSDKSRTCTSIESAKPIYVNQSCRSRGSSEAGSCAMMMTPRDSSLLTADSMPTLTEGAYTTCVTSNESWQCEEEPATGNYYDAPSYYGYGCSPMCNDPCCPRGMMQRARQCHDGPMCNQNNACQSHTQELVDHMKRLSEYIPEEAKVLVKQVADIITSQPVDEIKRQTEVIVEETDEQKPPEAGEECTCPDEDPSNPDVSQARTMLSRRCSELPLDGQSEGIKSSKQSEHSFMMLEAQSNSYAPCTELDVLQTETPVSIKSTPRLSTPSPEQMPVASINQKQTLIQVGYQTTTVEGNILEQQDLKDGDIPVSPKVSAKDAPAVPAENNDPIAAAAAVTAEKQTLPTAGKYPPLLPLMGGMGMMPSPSVNQCRPLLSAAAARVTGVLRHSYPLGKGARRCASNACKGLSKFRM